VLISAAFSAAAWILVLLVKIDRIERRRSPPRLPGQRRTEFKCAQGLHA
jgi:hypothetical protein